MLDLLDILKSFESLIGSCFLPASFNYVISGQYDQYFHLHALPRYDHTVLWRDREWFDDRWPLFLTFPHVDRDAHDELSDLAAFLRSMKPRT
jgi:diadenosine tetraphosphate (Ap4A) HIT family hydrolase